jgi:DNA-binding beta-propeller fold protein YncE
MREHDCDFRKDLGIQQRGSGEAIAKRANVGETVGMMWHKNVRYILLAMAFASLWVSGCGSSGVANQVIVTVTGQFSVMVPTQTQTITATVTGATDVSSTFDCSYTTTPNPTTAVPSPKPSASAVCNTAKTASGDPAVGDISNTQNTSTTVASTTTFTAPKVFPDQTKLPNVIITITATSKSDTKKTGKFSFTFDSGIRIHTVPATATLATSSTQLFLAEDFNNTVINDPTHTLLKWGVTFEVTARINSADCSTGSNSCGSIDANGLYTAPATVPTAAPASTTTPVNAAGIVTVFVFSQVDNARIAQAAVTIVKAGNITFSGISPSVVPQGAVQQDIFLAATNATSQLGITLTAPCGNIPVDPQTQVKVLFAPGTTASSIGARVRLSNIQLTVAGHYQVQVTSSNPSVTVTGGPFPLDVVPVRPTIVSSNPDNLQEATLTQNPITIDGGYFGATQDVGTLPTCTVSPTITPLFNNTSNAAAKDSVTGRKLIGFTPIPSATNPNAGFFPLSVQYSTSPGPFAVPVPATAYTNIAVIPDYAGSNSPSTPTSFVIPPVPVAGVSNLPTVTVPSAIAMDSTLGYAVLTLAGQNAILTGGSATVNAAHNIQFINLSSGTPVLAASASSQGFLATGVAVDDRLTDALGNPAHVAAVVNYASRTLSVHSIPSGALLGTVDLSNLIPPPATGGSSFVAPFPYSVGIDPFSHRAIVAFASTNVGLIINLDPNATPACILPPTSPGSKYCAVAYITLSSGSNPQIAFEPGAQLAYVTPGGTGQLSAVSLANPTVASVGIATATRASNVVTITTSAAHNLNPGNPGTVLISNLPVGSTNKTNFDGSFAVGVVLDATHFQYSQADKDDTSTCPAPTPPSTAPVCTANSGVPFLTYQVSPSTLGIAINPITRRILIADHNATFSQLNFIDPQSELVSPMTVFLNATGAVSTGSPEIGAAAVAFQPFTNTALSFNSQHNQVSLLDPSLFQRAAIVSTGQTAEATASFTPAGMNATAITVNLHGALAADAINNVALAVNSGSDNISFFQLGQPGKVKTLNIERVETPSIDDPKLITVPANLSPAVKITLGAPSAAVSPVKIFGSGFINGTSKVRLDAVDITTLGATVAFISSQELDATFPPGFFTGPHHFALDVASSAFVTTNIVDFTVLEEIPLSNCNVTATSTGTPAAPGGVAIDEVNNLAVVTNTGSGCNQVSVFSLNPAKIFNQTLKTIATGDTPTGVAVLPRLAYIGQPAGTQGVAVVTNNVSNSVSLIDLVNAVPVLDASSPKKPITVSVGNGPSGVAIDQETNLAVTADTTANGVSTIDLTPIAQDPSNPSKALGALSSNFVAVDLNPIAVAIDPDRGTNGRGLAVVTCLQSNGASSPFGELVGVDIGLATPIRSTTASTSFLSSTPTGIVFDPSVSPALFYAVSTQGNVITSFNPDTSQTQTIKVGINPNAIAYNFQTGTILTVNSLSNTISIVDSQTFATKATLGIGATSKFAAAIQTFTNLAVIADQANNRVILFPLPK